MVDCGLDIKHVCLAPAGFVVGLPEVQKHRLYRFHWARMVAAYRLLHACRTHVQQLKTQQVHSLIHP